MVSSPWAFHTHTGVVNNMLMHLLLNTEADTATRKHTASEEVKVRSSVSEDVGN